MAKYPELEGAPKKCLNTSPMTIDPLKIRAPYGKVDNAEVLQPGIVSIDWEKIDGVSPWELFTSFWQGKNQDENKGIGWQSGAELKALDKLLKLANNIIDKKDKYESNSRSKIVNLAKAAKAQLKFIADRYDVWNNKGFSGKSPYGIQWLSLYRTEAEIKAKLARDEGHIWPHQRREDRKKIRKAWDKALRFLWCAVYGANQSKVYLENKSQFKAIPKKKILTPLETKKVASIPKRLQVKKVTLIPATQEPDFVPGMPMPEEEEVIEEEEFIEEEIVERPKKKKGMGLVIVGAAAVALLAMKK